MALITFMSDFGLKDHYVAAVKAKILSINPGLQILDISHQIEPFNISHGSHVLKMAYQDFPSGTVHLVAINSTANTKERFMAMKLNNHFFVGSDNGLFGLLSDKVPTAVVELNAEKKIVSTFPAKDILAQVTAQLASGMDIQNLGKNMLDFNRLLPRQAKATKSEMVGQVIHIDHYGNLITNIDKTTFDMIAEGKQIEILFAREKINKIHSNYHAVDQGECFVVFNSAGLLEIGINHGNAKQLLGLNFESAIIIRFS
jgi:S-adenosyl-L-methionine hydrolase (adenosine-forming)